MVFKTFFFILFSLIIWRDSFSQQTASPSLNTAQKPSAAGSFLRRKVSEDSDGLFEKMKKHPVLKGRIKTCRDILTGGQDAVHPNGQQLSDCVWKNTHKDERLPVISEEDEKKYYEDLGLLKKGVAQKDKKTFVGAEGIAVDKKTKTTEDEGLKALGEFLSKKLKEQFLKGLTEDDKKKDILIDHTSFNKLYKTRVSKNIISSISNYCLQATTKGFLQYDPYNKDNEGLIKKLKKENLEKLNKFTENKNDAFVHWAQCLGQIKHICRQKENYDPKKDNWEKSLKSYYDNEDDHEKNKRDFDYSSDTACLVNSTIKGLRRILSKVKKIELTYDSLKGNDKGKYFKNSGVKVVSAGDLDEMTSLTSGELENSGIKEKSEKMADDIKEKCGKNENNKECLKIVNIRNESKTHEDIALLEYKTKVESLERKITSLSEDDIQKYLEENKYTNIKLSDDELKAIRDEMKDEFKREKEALVKRMNKLIEERSVEGEQGQIDFNKKTKGIFEHIETGLRNRTKEYTQLLHFNNIVSGFLNITMKEDAEETANERVKISNIQSIDRELKSMAGVYDPEDKEGEQKAVIDRDASSKDPLKELKEKMKKADRKPPTQFNENFDISGETISDQMLQFKTVEEAKRKEKEKKKKANP